MMAYESHLQSNGPPPGVAEAGLASQANMAPANPRKKQKIVVQSGGVLEQKTDNPYMIPIAVAEAVLLIAMLVMNYLFRFDSSVRDSSSLANYEKLSLSPTDILPARPYYNYSLSLEKNQDQLFTFGISFSMEEYAFFVPFFIVPLLLVLLAELIFMFHPKGHLKTVTSFQMSFNTFTRRSIRIYYVYLLYASLTGMVTSFIKLLVPMPRPHFIAVCNPLGPIDQMFVVDQVCFPDSWSNLNEALRSFPSYHATLAFYAGTFIVLYLMYMANLKGTYSSGCMLSLPVIVMAIIGGLHRWCTFHSHGRDIAWGAVIGIIGALWAVKGLLNSFEERVWALNLIPTAPMSQRTVPSVSRAQSVKSVPAQSSPLYSINESNRAIQISAKPDAYADGRAPSRVRVQMPRVPSPRSPAQAFNAGFESDPESPIAAVGPYNLPRQRYSVPAIQMRPMVSRPPSAHPSLGGNLGRRPASRYEGASYF